MLEYTLFGRSIGRKTCRAGESEAAVSGFIEAAGREQSGGSRKTVSCCQISLEGRAGMADLHRFATRGVPSNPNRPQLRVHVTKVANQYEHVGR